MGVRNTSAYDFPSLIESIRRRIDGVDKRLSALIDQITGLDLSEILRRLSALEAIHPHTYTEIPETDGGDGGNSHTYTIVASTFSSGAWQDIADYIADSGEADITFNEALSDSDVVLVAPGRYSMPAGSTITGRYLFGAGNHLEGNARSYIDIIDSGSATTGVTLDVNISSLTFDSVSSDPIATMYMVLGNAERSRFLWGNNVVDGVYWNPSGGTLSPDSYLRDCTIHAFFGAVSSAMLRLDGESGGNIDGLYFDEVHFEDEESDEISAVIAVSGPFFRYSLNNISLSFDISGHPFAHINYEPTELSEEDLALYSGIFILNEIHGMRSTADPDDASPVISITKDPTAKGSETIDGFVQFDASSLALVAGKEGGTHTLSEFEIISNPDNMPAMGSISPRITTADLPSASSVQTGTTFYDTTAGNLVVSNGTTWQAVTGGTAGISGVEVLEEGFSVGTRPTLNFHEGSNVTLTIADDAGNDEIDITIAATGGGGGGSSAVTGAGLYLASTTPLAAANGTRPVEFDTVYMEDAGWTASTANNSLTVPNDGWYSLYGHIRLDSFIAGLQVLAIRDVDTSIDYGRGSQISSNHLEVTVSSVAYIEAGSEIGLVYYSANNTQVVGGANPTYTALRAVYLGSTSGGGSS